MEERDCEDLTQLPGVTLKMQRRLREMGYDTLYEVAEAYVNDLIDDIGISKNAAKQMISAANKFLGYEEE